jgi:hypothetical protein
MFRFRTKAPRLPCDGSIHSNDYWIMRAGGFPCWKPRYERIELRLGTYHIQYDKFRRNAPSNRQHTGPDPAGHIEVSPSPPRVHGSSAAGPAASCSKPSGSIAKREFGPI